jgi:hypothetical protein
MDYIKYQFNKIFETKGETLNLKIQAEGAHTNWLSITEHEAELKDLGSNYMTGMYNNITYQLKIMKEAQK